ncbi:MAG: chemotaxis protein CheW [Nitrospirota bacterium]
MTTQGKKFAVFTIGRDTFGIEIDRVIEILHTKRVYTLPELPEFLSGVITVRGEVIPLLDLRKRFGIHADGGQELTIIVRYDSEKIGLIVEKVQEIVTLLAGEIIAPPTIFKGLKKKYLTGIGKKDERIIILLNLDFLLSSEEKLMLKESEEILEEHAKTGDSA